MQCELTELPTGQAENSEMDGEILEVKDLVQGDNGQQNFLVNLYEFMKERGTPIERIPHLGFKQVNLLTLYKAVEKLGGYEAVTTSRLWKNIYDELGGNPGSTSAATCTRRHYERLVLPYERYMKGEEDKPLPTFKPRKPYNVMKNKEGKGLNTEQKERSKRKRPKDNVRQSSEPDRMVPQVVSEDVGRDKKKHASVDKQSPQVKNTTTGSEDSNNQPLNRLTPHDSCGHKSPNQDAKRANEKPTQDRISEELWVTKDSSPETISRAGMSNKIVDHNGHCVTADVSEEVVRGHTAVSKDERTGSYQAPALSASEDSLTAPLPPEADKSHLAILRLKRDQEIMSPLAKKKFLAQGSEGTSLSFNAVGVASSSAGVKPVQGSEPPVSGSPPEASIHRPSVIHHIQPPRQAHLDYHSEWSFNNKLAKYQLYSLDQISSSTDGQGPQEERDRKGRAVEHSHPLQCYGNFCCSPYMHSLVKPFLHYPSKGSPFGCCSNQRSFRELNSTAVPTLPTASYKTARHYDRTLVPHDQPTDLSLPRASTANTSQTQLSWVTENKNSTFPLSKSPFAGHTSPSSSEVRPKACWVPPMSVTLPRRVPAKRAKSAVLLTNAKSGPSNCQLAQPTQRSQKELDAAYGKKLRIVSPLHVTKHLDTKEGQRINDSKVMSNEQKSSLPEVSTWLPTVTPQDPTLYDGAGAYLPANYAHHLSRMKNPTLYSPYIPRLTINSFMIPAIQQHVLSSPSHPLDLYKHLAVGTSYENLFRHRLYPSPPLSSFHAGHKL